MALKGEILAQIDAVLASHKSLRSRSRWSDLSDLPEENATSISTLMCDTIRRFAPPHSQYIESMQSILKEYGAGNANVVPHMVGILSALRQAYEANYLDRVAELIHAEVFGDFIEMAEYLLSEGYKDPAAVLIGSVLEEHLRQLCARHGIDTETAGRPKAANQLNSDLTAYSVYSKLDQKGITAWLDLRNKAAHGKYAEYTKEQVALLLSGVRDFMTRNSA
jgi:hypothetical protein